MRATVLCEEHYQQALDRVRGSKGSPGGSIKRKPPPPAPNYNQQRKRQTAERVAALTAYLKAQRVPVSRAALLAEGFAMYTIDTARKRGLIVSSGRRGYVLTGEQSQAAT